ncbi:hypothetical protein EMPS_04327 [Entomortierella parvispora]|uniref:Uncharacterized protein n=1 Tax=Entomortierella parvispora TaxID=205924 RepID=A0A9P3H8C8_9FUNG|nr:hypothetical protein EMPS_04327 [Entomortierella parvispora]
MAAPALHASRRESLDSELRGELDLALPATPQRDGASDDTLEEQDLDKDRTESETEVQGSNACPSSKKNSKRPRLNFLDLASASARASGQASVMADKVKWDTDATDSEPELRQSRLPKAQLLAKSKKRWMRGQTRLEETSGAPFQVRSLPFQNSPPKSVSTRSVDSRYDSLESGSYNTHMDSTDSEMYDFGGDDDERTDSEPEPTTRRLCIRPEEAIGVFISAASELGSNSLQQCYELEATDEDRTDSDSEPRLGLRPGPLTFSSDIPQQPAWSRFWLLPPMGPMSSALQHEGGDDTDSDVELIALAARRFNEPSVQDVRFGVFEGNGPALRTFFVDISAASFEDPSTATINIPSEQYPEEDESTETDDERGIVKQRYV